MEAIDIFFTLLLNCLPIIILVLPLPFIWNKYIGKVYFRIVVGIVVFFLLYWVLPIIFQIGEEPKKLVIQEGDERNMWLGIRYIAAHLGSLIAIFAHYPLVTLPFIFFTAPFVSMLYLRILLRKGKGFQENLKQLTYEYTESPYRKIRNAVLKNDWSREKQILKLLIVFLPISLYLLQVILDLSNLQNISFTEGYTAIGWFLEILFVYFAVFIFSIELLFSSKVALKGRYFGENFKEHMYRSLYTVGAPISLLSLILFWIQYGTSIFIVIYFFAFFIMASVLFVLFLDVFEPISILIFIKLIDWWKNKEERIKNIYKTNWYYGIILGCFGVIFFLLLNIYIGVPLFNLFKETQSNIIASAKYEYEDPTLRNSFRFDLMIMFNFVALIVVPIIITSLLLAFCLKRVKSALVGIITFISTIITFSIIFIFLGANPLINFTPEEYWLTGQASYTDVFGFKFYTLRTAALDANLFPGEKITLLGVLALPYLYTRYIFNIIIWTLMIFYFGKDFKIKVVSIDEKDVEKIAFSTVSGFIKYSDYLKGKNRYLITKTEKIVEIGFKQEREEAKNLLKILDEDKLLEDVKPKEEDPKKQFYSILKSLYSNKLINIWKPEFSFITEKVEKQGLYMIYKDGRGVFHYPFVKEALPDSGIVSGMFSAITSFVKETTKSTQLLKTIDHGDITILIEYGQHGFGALFIKGAPSSEIRAQLKEFVEKFEIKHQDILVSWNGLLRPFGQDHLLVNEIFKQE